MWESKSSLGNILQCRELSERFGMRFAASFFLGSCNIRNALVCIDFINGIDNLQRLARGNIGVVKVKK